MLAEPKYASLEARVRLLRSMPDLLTVSPDTLTLLAEGARFRRYEARTALWSENDAVASVLYVIEGTIRVERNGRLLGMLDGRGAVGLISALAMGALGVTAVAVTSTVGLEIPADAMRLALQRDFGFLRMVLRSFARTLLARNGSLHRSEEPPTVGVWRDDELTLVERIINLRRSPLGRANLDALADIASSVREVRFQKGDVIWRVDDPATNWLRIEYGLVRSETAGGEATVLGSEYHMGFLEPLAELPRTTSAHAETPVIGLRIELADWLSVVELHVSLAYQFTSFLARAILTAEPEAGPTSRR